MESVHHSTGNKNILIKFAVVSIVIHLSVSFIHFSQSDFFKTEDKAEAQKLLVRLIKQNKASQIVQTETGNKLKPKDAKFLSKVDNSFARQTKNKNIGTFAAANKGSRDATQEKEKQLKKSKIVKNAKTLKFSDLAVKRTEKIELKKNKKIAKSMSSKLGLKNGQSNGKALGRTNDFLEDIPLGDFTQLNTQEFEFYGFYDRIRQKLEQYWGNNLREEADKIFKQGRSIASDNNLITSLTIKIDATGKIVNILLNSTSGLRELDDAAIKSFNQAGPFPNPPKGMLQADGKAVIEWGFVVNT